MNDVQETIKDIKSKFRLFMNGVISQSMREKGMDYKLNFGIEYSRIREIAAEYEKNHELAQALWKENIRECKIIATLLQPADTFCKEIAEIWIDDMKYPELAEYTVMNILQHVDYASDVVFKWMADERPYYQFCGYMLMTRLLMKGMKLNERAEAEFMDQAFTEIEGGEPMVKKAAATALKKFSVQSKDNAKLVSRQLGLLSKTANPELKLHIDEIKYDIEYCQ